ncbi:MAG: carboxypeptidase-like regulatory domain-containing protein, partial [Candidatus Diapherotrites archaeon]
TDSYGYPIENARVSFSPESDNALSIVGYTDSYGNLVSMIAAGNYTVVVVKDGYFSSVLENVIVPTNNNLSIRLEPKSG